MHSTRKVRWAVLMLTMLLSGIGVFASDIDDYVPEVTDRVARISFVQGDVQIRRADTPDWEVAVLNLPIVEGDEIASDGNGRFEIQFNSYTHLRVAENSHIKVVKLKDEGIAVSLPLGTASLRMIEFDAGRSFFEIDAPSTTISMQKPGTYRVEAGVPDSLEVFVSATDGGEARVYSYDAGFTVKNGRRTRIFIGGDRSGEWDVADASKFIDEFDKWGMDRDEVIAARLKDAYYDRYYDDDIYGAEDLNDHGQWIQTQKYGYVWRPYQTSISQYSDWSPYRYGQWRWIPAYGWTWVNDEPWGWATYHHGRWVWYNGGWYWTPYGYYRYSRSWWHPALVVISVIGNNVCWYPLPYQYGYYNYNSHYYSHNPRRSRYQGSHNSGGGPVAANPTPTPSPGVPPAATPIRTGRDKLNVAPLDDVPPSGVVSVAASEFGRGRGKFLTPPLSVAQSVLSKAPDVRQTPPVLPTYADLNGKVSQDIRVARPPIARTSADTRTGAATRSSDAPLDQELQKSRIFGNRAPLQINTGKGEIRAVPGENTGPRKTGAVERPVVSDSPVRQAPTQRQEAPVYSPPVKQQQEEPVRPPRYEPPPTSRPRDEPVRTPRYEPPARRADPPPRSTPPPRNDPPPTRSVPPSRNDPPPKSDPPPQKSEPSKPAPAPVERKARDGR